MSSARQRLRVDARLSTDNPEPSRTGGEGGSAGRRRRPASPSPVRRPAADRAGRRGTPHGTPELSRRAEERQSRPRHERRAMPPAGTSLTSRPRSLDPARLRQESRPEPPQSAQTRPRTPEPPRSRPPELPRSRPSEPSRSLGESIGLRVESALERLLTSGGVPASPKSSPRGQRAAVPSPRRPATAGRSGGGGGAAPVSPEAKRQRRQPATGEGAPPTGRPRPAGSGGSGSSTPTQQRRPEVRTTRTTVIRQKVKSQPLSVPAVVTRAVLVSGAPLTERRNGEWFGPTRHSIIRPDPTRP